MIRTHKPCIRGPHYQLSMAEKHWTTLKNLPANEMVLYSLNEVTKKSESVGTSEVKDLV